MKYGLLTGIAAIALMTGTDFASAQAQSPPPAASPQAQPNTQTRDQEGTPGTGMSQPAPAQNQGTMGQGTRAPAPTTGQGTSGQAYQGGTANPAAQPDSRDRDQEGTPGTGKSAPAAGGSPRQ
jgi:hypothetical protein